MARELPKVRIDDKEYYMDSRLLEFRSISRKEPIKFLSFDKVMDSEAKVTLLQPSKDVIRNKEDIIISCLKAEEIDYLDNMITDPKNKDLLFKIPVCKE